MTRQTTLDLATGEGRRQFVSEMLGREPRRSAPQRTIEMGWPVVCPACAQRVSTFCTLADRTLVLATHRFRTPPGRGASNSEVCRMSLLPVKNAAAERLRRLDALMTDTSRNPDLLAE